MDSVLVPPFVVAGLFLVALAVDNVRSLRLRDVLTLGGTGATAAALLAASAVQGELNPVLGGFLGGVGAFVILLVVELVRPTTLGLGTVKAGPVVGIPAGAAGLTPWALALAAFAVVLGMLLFVALRGGPLRVPSGPALCVALLVAARSAMT